MIEQLTNQLRDGGSNPTSPLQCFQYDKRLYYSKIEQKPMQANIPLKESRVIPILLSQAKPIILKYEYLGTTGSWNFKTAFGHFFGDLIGGAILLAQHKGAHKAFTRLLPDKKVVQLARGVNLWWTPKNSGSFFISKVCDWLRVNTDIDVLTATADPCAGEIGTIYQSLNWIYLGQPTNGYPVYIIDGKEIHPKALYVKHGSSSRDLIKDIYGDRVEIRPRIFKHRYIYSLRDKLDIKSLPYPKRLK